MLNFDDKYINNPSNDPHFAKTEEKRQKYHMNELEKQLKQLQRLSKFEVDFNYKKLDEIVSNHEKLRVESGKCYVNITKKIITYKDVIKRLARTKQFKEFDEYVLVDLELTNESLLIATFVS